MTPPQPAPDLSGAPAWFVDAVARPQTASRSTTSDGFSIHSVCWNPEDSHKPPLMFVHGYRASTHAWDFIAPWFCEHFRVHALDLGGMGESDHRPEYCLDTFCRDIDAAVSTLGDDPVTLVGHSFGGVALLAYLQQHPQRVKHLVLIDSYIAFPGDEATSSPRKGRPTPYPDYDAILARYVLLPPQPSDPWVFNFMAHHAIRPVAGGWTWRFDVNLPGGKPLPEYTPVLARYSDHIDYISGEHSALVTPDKVRQIAALMAGGRKPVVIPNSYHHVMLDQPLALVAALRALLA